MKSLFASFVFFLAFCLGSFSQVITDSAFVHHQIVTGVLQAPYIFEGEVLTTESYYSPNHDFIYTSNTVRVNQAWKENDKAPFKRDEIVEVITRGGTVGDNTLWITHQIGFVPGQKGMFLCSDASFPTNPNSSTPQAQNLMLFDGLYFDFDYSNHYISVSYANINFDCLEKLYEILDPTFIAECLGVNPDPYLYQQRYETLEAYGNELQGYRGDDNGTVTYTFENAGTVVTDGQEYLEFDIFIASSIPVYFLLGTVQIDYNPNAFGINIVQSSGITVQRGEVMTPYLNYENPAASDMPGVNNHTFSIIASAAIGAPNLHFLDSNTPKQLVHVKMKIEDCGALPDLKFAELELSRLLTLYYPVGSPNGPTNHNYAEIIANDQENSALCGMQISGFSPTTVNAGTGDVVTINGSGFGTSGTVQMKNAEGEGPTWISLDDYDVDWSDTGIKITVPSVGPFGATNDNATYTAGSGPIRIISGNEMLVTDEELNVYYAWKNYQIQNWNTTIKGKGLLSGVDLVYDEDFVNQEYGYKLVPNINFTNTAARKAVVEAMRRWSCESGIRWEFADSESTTSTNPEDHISSIRFGTTSSLSRLAETQVFIQRCAANANDDEMGFSWSFDIVVSNAAIHPFLYDETGLEDQPVGFYDFYSVILHELGHAHLLRHVNDESDLMYWALLPNTNNINSQDRKIFFSNSNLDGATDILNSSVQTSLANCQYNLQPHEPLSLSNCGTSNSLEEVQNHPIHLVLIPNPSSEIVTIRLDAFETSQFDLILFDQQGRRMIFDSWVNCSAGVNDIPIDISNLNKGVYTVMLRNKHNVYTSKLVVL